MRYYMITLLKKEIHCESIKCDSPKKKASGINCFDNSGSSKNIILLQGSKSDIEKIKSEKIERKENLLKKRIAIEEELRRNKCGIYGLRRTPSQKVVPCPDGTTEYKYYYGDRCRKIKNIKSNDIITQSRNLPMIICIPNVLRDEIFSKKGIILTDPKEQFDLERKFFK